MDKQVITLVGVSDIHGNLVPATVENFWPEGDILCICGDTVPLEYQSDTTESITWMGKCFYPWIESLPYKKVLMIAGNHDFFLEKLSIQYRNPNAIRDKLLMPSKLIYLEDSGAYVYGFHFYGTPWCPDLKNWAFYGDSDFLKKKFQDIPKNLDVLLTHAAPRVDTYGTTTEGNCMKEFGCPILAENIRLKKPQVSLFGHIHSGKHTPETIEGTTFANVSLLSERYKVTYSPIVLNLSKQHGIILSH